MSEFYFLCMLTDSRGEVLAKRLVTFRNGWTQGWGLMFRKPAADTAYLFLFDREMSSSFHMLFVCWPIDLYLLDKRGKIVDKKLNFRPFSVFTPEKPYWHAIETRPGLFPPRIGRVAIKQ